jgi:uncharacterized protein
VLLALLDRDDPNHEACAAALASEHPAYLVPAGIPSEPAYLTELKVDSELLATFLDDLAGGSFTLECEEGVFCRIVELVRRYADLALGFADASVVALARSAPVVGC